MDMGSRHLFGYLERGTAGGYPIRKLKPQATDSTNLDWFQTYSFHFPTSEPLEVQSSCSG
jgi:hypothetical protein